MRIGSSITLQKDDIIGQPNEQVKIQIAQHLANDIAQQIVKLVHKEMRIIEGHTHEDPFGMRIEFSIEAELRESDRKRKERDRERMRSMVSTPLGQNSPFYDAYERHHVSAMQEEQYRREREEMMREMMRAQSTMVEEEQQMSASNSSRYINPLTGEEE